MAPLDWISRQSRRGTLCGRRGTWRHPPSFCSRHCFCIHTQLCHTPSFFVTQHLSYTTLSSTMFFPCRSSMTSFVFPSFPVPPTTFVDHCWKKLTCEVIRSFNLEVFLLHGSVKIHYHDYTVYIEVKPIARYSITQCKTITYDMNPTLWHNLIGYNALHCCVCVVYKWSCT